MNTKLLVLDCKTNILRKFSGRQFVEAAVLSGHSENTREVWLAEIEAFRVD